MNMQWIEKLETTPYMLKDLRQIIESSKNATYASVNIALLQRNWLIGK